MLPPRTTKQESGNFRPLGKVDLSLQLLAELLMVKIGCLLACDVVPAPGCQLESREVLVPEGFVCILIPACSGTQ